MQAFLFVCLANQCRSPIAAATFRSAWVGLPGAKPCRVASAGTWTDSGLAVGVTSLDLAQAVGVDLRRFRTTSIEDVRLGEYDWIIVMEAGQQEALSIEHPELRERIQLLTALAGMFPSDIPDPLKFDRETALGILRDMQQCARQLARKMSKIA